MVSDSPVPPEIGTKRSVLDEFKRLLEAPPTPGRQKEQEVQDFLELNSELIPTPILGNHQLHFNLIISKLPLGHGRQVDYAYLTKSSDKWQCVLVELERPEKKIFTDSGKYDEFSAEFNSAISQVLTWRDYLDSAAKGEVERLIEPLKKPLADNRLDFEYALVIGRDSEKRNNARRRTRLAAYSKDIGICVLTYDSVIRMAEHRYSPKNIVRMREGHFVFTNIGDWNTLMFGWVSSEHLSLTPEQVATWTGLGYDIAAWQEGRLLRHNGVTASGDPLFDMGDGTWNTD
jgi:hypothetical protein